MRQLNGVYTQRTNRRHGLVGHLFQGRFTAILVERDAYLLELARYVVLNPVRAGMVAAAEGWAWSSYRPMVGQASAPAWLETDWLLGQFSEERVVAQAGYADFVRQGVGGACIWEGLRHQVFLGSEGFAERHRATTKPLERLREIPRAQRRALAEPLAGFARRYPRDEAMARAFATGVYTMQEIAAFFGEAPGSGLARHRGQVLQSSTARLHLGHGQTPSYRASRRALPRYLARRSA